MNKLRVVIADDERPAREFLKALLSRIEEVHVIGEAENGADALELIKIAKPDLAFLDLQMPELTGLEIVGMLRKNQMPLVAFVTAFDEFAVKAFELNAIDYLLKPVEKARLEATIQRAVERLEHDDWRETQTERLRKASANYDHESGILNRIPVKKGEDILLIPVGEITSIVADGELLHLTTALDRRYTINFRLKDLEEKLGGQFVRLSRGALVNLDAIERVSPVPGGTYMVTLKNGHEVPSSRLQSKILRARLLKL
jgi:two-component system, LytTR family, response regulator